MKKIFTVAVMIIALLALISLTACNDNAEEAYTLVAPDGAPALAIAKLSSQITSNDTVYKINKKIVSAAVIDTEAVDKGTSMAVVPANVAANICNGNGGYKILASVTNGNLYMMSSISANVESLEDIVGKIVYSIGQSSVPDMIFKSLLSERGIPFAIGENAVEGKVIIKYCADGAEVVSKLALAKEKEQVAFGIYAEPLVTKSKANGFVEVFDLQNLWSQTNGSQQNGYAQAVLIVRNELCEDREFIDKLLEAFAESSESVKQDPTGAVENIKNIYPQSSLQSNMTKEIIDRCNVNTVVAIGEGRTYLERTLQAILEHNPNAIRGKLPSDECYIA